MADPDLKSSPSRELTGVVRIFRDLSPFHFDSRAAEPHLPEELHRSMQLAVSEGALAGIMAVMIGGVVLTGLALSLGANEFIIGLIAAIQAGGHLLQMRAYHMLERAESRKAMAVKFAAASRLIWVAISALLFLTVEPLASYRIWVFLLLFALSTGLGITSAVAWVSWLVDLVPQRLRGRFFAQRNIAAGAVGVILGIAAGQFIDLWKDHTLGPETHAFAFLIVFGLVFGLWAVAIQNRMYDPPFPKPHAPSTFWESLKIPFGDRTFRRIFLFRIFYDLSLGTAGTFYGVYMLTQAGLSFTFVAAMAMLTTLSNLLSLKSWGSLIDRYGNKPILYICLAGQMIFALLWLFTTPSSFWLYVLLHLFGVFDAGKTLVVPNLIYKIAPAERRANYITVDGAVVGIAATVAPLIGGGLAVLFSSWSLDLGVLRWEHFHFLFFVSLLLRFVTFFFLRRVQEPEAMSVTDVVSVLRPIRSIDIYAGVEIALDVMIAPVKYVIGKLVPNRKRRPLRPKRKQKGGSKVG